MKKSNSITGFILGAASILLLLFLWGKFPKLTKENSQNDYYIIKNQITKLNKMVVMEQNFTTLQKTNTSLEFLGTQVSENEIMTFTTTKAQVTYDLNQMKIEVDSISKKLIIKSLPQAEITITPSVEIRAIDDSFFNRVNENQIKKVTETAKQNAIKTVDQNKLRTEGRKQLLENLNQIFVLAKALKYEIVDETQTIDQSIWKNL